MWTPGRRPRSSSVQGRDGEPLCLPPVLDPWGWGWVPRRGPWQSRRLGDFPHVPHRKDGVQGPGPHPGGRVSPRTVEKQDLCLVGRPRSSDPGETEGRSRSDLGTSARVSLGCGPRGTPDPVGTTGADSLPRRRAGVPSASVIEVSDPRRTFRSWFQVRSRTGGRGVSPAIPPPFTGPGRWGAETLRVRLSSWGGRRCTTTEDSGGGTYVGTPECSRPWGSGRCLVP